MNLILANLSTRPVAAPCRLWQCPARDRPYNPDSAKPRLIRQRNREQNVNEFRSVSASAVADNRPGSVLPSAAVPPPAGEALSPHNTGHS